MCIRDSGKIADDTIAEGKLDVHNAPATDKYLKYTSNGMEWSDGASEGTDVKSTGESGTTKFLRVDGDGTCSWQVPPDNNTVYTHPNHSGEVTSSADGAQTIASNVVDEDNLKVSNSPTNGQFLQAQSGNTGGLTWANVTIPPAGNTFTATANGAIANNKAVKIDTDGKVSEISEAVTALSDATYITRDEYNNLGGDQQHQRRGTQFIYHAAREMIVQLYRDDTDSFTAQKTIKARAGTFNTDGSIAWSSSVVSVFSSYYGMFKACYDPDSEKIAVCSCHQHSSDKRVLTMILTVAADKSISAANGTAAFAAGTGNPPWSVLGLQYDTANNKYVCLATRDTESGYGDSTLWSVVGVYNAGSNEIAWGSRVILDSSLRGVDYGGRTDMCYDSTNGKMVVVTGWYNSSLSPATGGKTIEGTVSSSSSTITWANMTVLESNDISTPRITHDPTSGKNILFYKNTSNSAKIRTMSGTTYGSAATLESLSSGGDLYEGSLVYDSGLGKCVFFYPRNTSSNNTSIKVSIITVSGTSVSLNTDTLFSDTSTYRVDEESLYQGCYDPVNRFHVGQVWNTAYGNSSNQKSEWVTFKTQAVTSNHTVGAHYVGYADAAYTNGQTATIKTYGNNVTTLSGLTAGTKYYVQGDGTVGTSAVTPSSLAGLALSATKLLITEPT